MKLSKNIFLATSLLLYLSSARAEDEYGSEYSEYSEYIYSMEEDEEDDIQDPYEKINRRIFAFNSVLDRFVLKPVAVTYKKVTNDYIKARVGSFIDNINTPLTTVNYGLQMNFNDGMTSMWRFIINTTLGVGGLFDVASKFNLNPKTQNFGSTLAHYGVAPGPYLVIPLLGGSSARDVIDPLLADRILNPIKYVLHKDLKFALNGVSIIYTREKLLPVTDHLDKSVDPYAATRSTIFQNREANVRYPKGFKYPTTSKIKGK